MRSFHFPIQARGSRFYVYMLDAEISKMPVKFGLKFMAVIRTNCMNAKRKFMNYVVNEINGVLLGMLIVNFQRPYPGRIIDGRILESSGFIALLIPEIKEFNIHLNMMARKLFFVTVRFLAFCGNLFNPFRFRTP